MGEQVISFDAYLSEQKINTSDVSAMKRAIDDYSAMLKNQQALAFTVDYKSAESVADFCDLDNKKLSNLLLDEKLISYEIADKANDIINNRRKALIEERDLLNNEIIKKRNRFNELSRTLGKSTSLTIRDDSSSSNSSNSSNSSSLQECIDNSKNRRNATLLIFEYLDKNKQQLTVQECVELIETKYAQDDYKQSHSACVRNVSKERSNKYVHVLK